MKLPYNESYCFCLENTDDVRLFSYYISPNLAVYVSSPLGYIANSNIPLPRFVNIRPTSNGKLSWDDEPNLPDGKFLIPIDALFNAEKYPEFLI